VAGAGALVGGRPGVLAVARVAGAVKLIGYAALAARRAVRPGVLTPAAGPGGGLRATLGTAAALTWLNPHATAVGQLLLAEQPSWRDVMPRGRLQQLTPDTLATFGDLDLHLQRIQDAPYVAQDGQLHADVSCLAVPVRSPGGALVAALAVSTTTTHAAALHGALDTLVGGATRLGPLLG
jgi:hypothetical protein